MVSTKETCFGKFDAYFVSWWEQFALYNVSFIHCVLLLDIRTVAGFCRQGKS